MSCEKEKQLYDGAVNLYQHAPTTANLNRLLAAQKALDKCNASQPIITAPLTKFDQAMVTVAGGHTYLFVVALDGRILYTRWKLGGGGNPWQEVGGSGIAYSGPAASIVSGTKYIFITVRGGDDKVWLNQGTLDPVGIDTWVGWRPMA